MCIRDRPRITACISNVPPANASRNIPDNKNNIMNASIIPAPYLLIIISYPRPLEIDAHLHIPKRHCVAGLELVRVDCKPSIDFGRRFVNRLQIVVVAILKNNRVRCSDGPVGQYNIAACAAADCIFRAQAKPVANKFLDVYKRQVLCRLHINLIHKS